MTPPPKRLTPRPGANWFERWRCERSLTKKQACEALGIAFRTLVAYEGDDTKIPLHVVLACSAISHGIPPMGGRYG
jgi:hypothetical protein